jgi:rubredoxin
MDNHLPPRYAFRLEDLRVWHVVRVSCRDCRHKAEIAPTALKQGRPGYTRLADIEGRLRCRNCGARGRASLLVELRPRD